MIPTLSPPASLPEGVHIAHADCFSGISGSLFLGALIHAGLDEAALLRQLDTVGLGPFTLLIEKRTIDSIQGISVSVDSPPAPDTRRLSAVLSLLDRSDLPADVVEKSAAVFRAMAEASAKVGGVAADQIQFNQTGALVTVIGSLIGLHHLGIERLISSPLPLGQDGARDFLPAPAVYELLQGIPAFGLPGRQELTAGGVALLRVLAERFGPMEPMTILRTGYGATACDRSSSSLFRLITGTACWRDESQEVEIIETHIDDWSPEGFPYVCDLLFARGALDVSLTPIQMKKGRPGFGLQVICRPVHGLLMKETILSETSAIGLRFRREQRFTLRREQVEVETRWGKIQAKKVWTPAGITLYPEYEVCRRIAEEQKVPLQQVYREVCARGQEI